VGQYQDQDEGDYAGNDRKEPHHPRFDFEMVFHSASL
jgi:hypothetical protein